MKRKTVTITLPVEMYQEVKEISLLNKRTFSSQLELLLEQKLREIRQNEKED